MSLPRKFLLGGLVWLGLVSVLHLWLNLGFFEPGRHRADGERPFRVGFLPVT